MMTPDATKHSAEEVVWSRIRLQGEGYWHERGKIIDQGGRGLFPLDCCNTTRVDTDTTT